MLPTNRERLHVGEFTGVNDVIDELKMPPTLAKWSHGGYYNNQNQFERLKGKLANSTSTSIGAIISLTQLNFDSTSMLLVHHASRLTIEDDLSPLQTDVSSINPMRPFISEN